MKPSLYALGLCGLTVFVSCGDSTERKQTAARPTLEVEAYRVSAQPFNSTVVVTAELRANEQVELMAPASGQVLEIFFNEGEKVTEGQSIIRMDDRSWKAQIIGLKAELDAATKDLERKKALLDIEGSTQEEIDQVTSRIETLRSQIQQLEINIELANVKAPFAGRLGLRNFSKGSYLREGDVITVITQLNRLKVDFALPQQYVNSIEVGKEIQVVVATDTLRAKVYAINPLIDVSSRTINARALIEQSGKDQVMPGTFAEAVVATDYIEDALMVPTQAVVPEINDQTVFLYRNGKVERKTVQLGNRTADLVHVTSGISEGDTLLTTGLLQLKPGMEVKLQTVNQ